MDTPVILSGAALVVSVAVLLNTVRAQRRATSFQLGEVLAQLALAYNDAVLRLGRISERIERMAKHAEDTLAKESSENLRLRLSHLQEQLKEMRSVVSDFPPVPPPSHQIIHGSQRILVQVREMCERLGDIERYIRESQAEFERGMSASHEDDS